MPEKELPFVHSLQSIGESILSYADPLVPLSRKDTGREDTISTFAEGALGVLAHLGPGYVSEPKNRKQIAEIMITQCGFRHSEIDKNWHYIATEAVAYIIVNNLLEARGEQWEDRDKRYLLDIALQQDISFGEIFVKADEAQRLYHGSSNMYDAEFQKARVDRLREVQGRCRERATPSSPQTRK
ncbi:MAG: hypothetical protein AAB553_05385 [Patescibacteria group bacterium]